MVWTLMWNSAITDLVGGGKLYQLHRNGHIYEYHGGWKRLDDNSATVQITADDNSGEFYQLFHSKGAVQEHTAVRASNRPQP